jgi:hypothetical protein
VKHLALRARSVRNSKNPFTTTGLGDRIHSLTLAWSYHNVYNVPVTIHLTKSKQIGGQYDNKKQSWQEILDLFPKDTVQIAYHDYEPNDEKDWIQYLKDSKIHAEIFWYKDHPGPHETPVKLDISQYLGKIPKLAAEPVDLNLPERFITCQWDSTDRARTLKPHLREMVMDNYKRQGYEVVVVGGESPDKNLNWSLKHIAYAMSKADMHVGVDSAFMHMAFLYMPFGRVHLYNEPNGFFSHHFRRAIDNGIKLNKYYTPVRLPDGTIL